MWNSQEKIKSAIPHKQNYAAWLVKNGKTVFFKLMQKISLSVFGEQARKHLASSFPFSDFYIFSSLLSCYSSGISSTLHFGQMLNEFLTSTFDFYWSLALQFSHLTVRLSEGRFLFLVLAISFNKKWASAVFYVDQLVHLLVCLVC